MKRNRIIGLLIGLPVALILTYLVGPRTHFDVVNNQPKEANNLSLNQLDSVIGARESSVTGLKPDNQASILWYDSVRQTDFAIVYLHGFSASRGEGKPVHTNVAKYFGANLYLARLPEHGIEKENVFFDLTPTKMVEAAKSAIAVGKKLGRKVILMSCSTGSTLSLYLSAGDPSIFAEILVSPNISMSHPLSAVLNNPWGIQLARKVGGGPENVINYDTASRKYWTDRYRWEGVVAVQELIEQTMHREVFGAVSHPVFCGYYYHDEEHQDRVISTEAIKKMQEALGTPIEQQRFIPFANGTNHVIISPLKNPNWHEVEAEIIRFCTEVLSMTPV